MKGCRTWCVSWSQWRSNGSTSRHGLTSPASTCPISWPSSEWATNTRWREEIRLHYAEISSQVPLGKRLREYFNPEKAEAGSSWPRCRRWTGKTSYYKFLDITISEARCLELHMEVDWIPIAQTRAAGCSNGSQYLLPGGIPKTYGLYAVGYEEMSGSNSSSSTEDKSSPSQEEEETDHCESGRRTRGYQPKSLTVTSALQRTERYSSVLFQHFQTSGKHYSRGEPSAVTMFLQDNCAGQVKEGIFSGLHIYIKFIEVELDFLSAGSLVECLETAIGHSLKLTTRMHCSGCICQSISLKPGFWNLDLNSKYLCGMSGTVCSERVRI